MVDAAVLVVSEMVTNAVVHVGGTAALELRIERHGQEVHLALADGSSVRPLAVEDDDPHGRGIHLIEAVADRWETRDHQGGKQVWVAAAATRWKRRPSGSRRRAGVGPAVEQPAPWIEGLTATTPRHIVSRYPYRLSIRRRSPRHAANRLGTWLRWLRATATFVFIAALCLAVALLVIAFIPGSPVTQELPAAGLTGLDRVGGVTAGVVVDPSGWVPFTIHDPSLAQRLLYLLTVLPGLVLVAEIARRMANLLRAAQASDPFTDEHRTGADDRRRSSPRSPGSAPGSSARSRRVSCPATMLDLPARRSSRTSHRSGGSPWA